MKHFFFGLVFLPVWVSFSALGDPAATFFDPAFDRLDLAALETLFRAKTIRENADTPEGQWEIALTEFALSESCRFTEEIHCEKRWLDSVVSRCLHWEFERFLPVNRGVAAGLCVIAVAEREAMGGWFLPWRRRPDLERYYKDFVEHPPETLERWYVEGRLFFAISHPDHRELTRSLFAWEALKRMKPDWVSSYYWLGRIHLSLGDEAWARSEFQKGLTLRPDDPRIGPLFKDGKWTQAAGRVEVPTFGIRPGLFYFADAGLGLGVAAWDDRLWDEKQSLGARASITSRGYYSVSGNLRDWESIPGTEVAFSGRFAKFTESDYGPGIQSHSAVFSEVKRTLWRGSLSATQSLGDPFSFSLGWEAAYGESKGGNFAPFSSYMGPWASVQWDTRDHRESPWTGSYLGLRGYFPTRFLGSSVTFQEWSLDARKYVWLPGGHLIRANAGVIEVSESAPYLSYPRLSGSFNTSGIRAGRYRDRAVSVLAIDVAFQVLPTLRLGPFACLGTVAPKASELLRSAWKLGAGGALESAIGSLRGSNVRLEAGTFADEWVVQAFVDASW